MSTIFAGAHVIGNFVDPQSWVSMVPDWYGHLFLIYSQDGAASQDDIILRAGQSEDNIVVQGGVTWESSADGITYWSGAAGVGDGGASYYGTVAISFEAPEGSMPNLEAIWQTLNDLALQIGNYSIDYNRIFQNSNSFINTLLDVVGAAVPEIETAGGNDYWFPAHEHVLSFDWLTLENYTYNLRGAHFLDANGAEVPINDNLQALRGPAFFSASLEGDFLSTFGGNDTLTDASRKDTLEGGTGDDTYVLMDDGAADIIITGEGDDIVRGGGAEDRLVLRIDILDKMYEDWRAQLEYSNLTFGTTYVLTGDALLKPSERMGEEASTSGLPILGGFWEMACDGVECVRLNTGTFYPTLSNPEEAGPGSLAATFPHLVYAYNWNDGDGIAQQAQVFPFGYRFELVDGDLVITFAYGTPPEGQNGVDIAQHTVTVKDFQDGDFGIHIYDPTLIMVPGTPVYEFDMHLEEWVVANSGPDSAYASVTDAEHVAYINNGGHYIPILAAIDPATTGSIPQSPPQPAPGIDGDENDNLITGGAAVDRFVFSSGNGHDRITDFAGNDFILLDVALATDFADAMSHASQSGADVAFTFGDDVMTLANRSLGSFKAGDFVFA